MLGHLACKAEIQSVSAFPLKLDIFQIKIGLNMHIRHATNVYIFISHSKESRAPQTVL